MTSLLSIWLSFFYRLSLFLKFSLILILCTFDVMHYDISRWGFLKLWWTWWHLMDSVNLRTHDCLHFWKIPITIFLYSPLSATPTPYILSSLYYKTTITRYMLEHFNHFSVLYVSQIPPHPLQIFIFLDSLFDDYFSVLPVHLCLNFLTYTFFFIS